MKTIAVVFLSGLVAVADERPFEEWLDEKVGTIACERADEIVGMLAALEQEHRFVLEKHSLVADAMTDVSSNAKLTRFAQSVARTIGSPFEDIQAEYVRFDYTSQVRGNALDRTLLLRLNADMQSDSQTAKALVCRLLAGQMINRNMIGQEKSNEWHRNLDDVCAICLGCGKFLMDSVRVERKSVDDVIQSSFSKGTSLSPVEVGWTIRAVDALRGVETELAATSIVQGVALERGRVALVTNLNRVRAVMKACQEAIDSGQESKTPSGVPDWVEAPAVPIPRPSRPLSGRKSVLSHWTPVPTTNEIAECKTASAKRFVQLQKSIAGSLETSAYLKATEAFSNACLSDGPDFALAAIGDVKSKTDRKNRKGDKGGIGCARWLSRVKEVTEARNYLRANEEILSDKTAHFYHHLEAAQRLIILGDIERALDQIAEADVQSAQVIDIMRGKDRSAQGVNSRIVPVVSTASQPPQRETKVAEYWWNFAKGKRKKVMDFARRISAEWYGKIVRQRPAKMQKTVKLVGDAIVVKEEKDPEWCQIAEQRVAFLKKAEQQSHEIRRQSFAPEVKTAGSSGISIPVFKGARESPPARLSSRTVTWRNRKREKTREEVLFQPRDFWEHGELAAGWMDEQGNELRVFRVRNLPLRDEDFDETVENGPTKMHLTERIAASTIKSADAKTLLQWASAFYGETFEKSALAKVPSGKMAEAHVLSCDGLSTGGVFLKTYRKEWFFVDMRLAGEVADMDALLRKLALGAKTMSWNKTGGAAAKEDGALVYTMPGYVVKVEMPQSLASSFMSRIKPMLEASMAAHRRYVPPMQEMKPSVLRVFNVRARYDAYVNAATERLENNTIGMWIPSREELVVMGGMKKVNDSIAAETFATLRHEAFHQYLFYATGRSGHAMWFNEGHACFFETGKFSSSSKYLSPNDYADLRRPRDVAKSIDVIANLIPVILPMTADEFYGGPLEEVNRRYAASWAVTYFLEKGIWVMDGMDAYKDVLPTYLQQMADGRVSAKQATEKAWEVVADRDVAKDFIRFWNDTRARKAARAYEPPVKK